MELRSIPRSYPRSIILVIHFRIVLSAHDLIRFSNLYLPFGIPSILRITFLAEWIANLVSEQPPKIPNIIVRDIRQFNFVYEPIICTSYEH